MSKFNLALRDYQGAVIDELRLGIARGHKRQVLALSTGGGKTVVAAHIARGAVAKGKRILFIVDRIELVSQAARTFNEIGLRVGILRGDDTNYSRGDDIIVASIQSIRARSAPDWIDLIVIDEAHILHKAHIDLIERWNAIPVIGLSATPLRKGLGRIFTNLVRGPTVADLTAQGFLVPARAFAPAVDSVLSATANVKAGTTTHGYDYNESALGAAVNTRELVGDLIETWQAKGEDRPTLVFAVNIAHSERIRDDFEAAGVTVGHLDAYTPADERRRLIDGFRAGRIRILSSVNVLGIGFDVPDAACLVLARPTLSESLHMQQMGRGIRPAPGKSDCILLDHSGNTLRFGLPIHFTVPDLDLGDGPDPAKKAKQEKPPRAVCRHCGAVMEPQEDPCENCGMDRPRPSSSVTFRPGELVELGAMDTPPDGFSLDDERQRFYRAAVGYLLARGKNPGAAYYLTQERFGGFKSPFEWRDLPPLAPTDADLRWIRNRQAYRAIRQQKAAARGAA